MEILRNYNVYLSGMEKSNSEKLFFLDFLNIANYDRIIDFGCGRGDILRACALHGGKNLIGIDHDYVMTNLAKQIVPEATFTNKLDKTMVDEKTLIIFSSVLHEVGDDWDEIEKVLAGSGCTVVVRDMYYTSDDNFRLGKDELSKLIRYSQPKILADFVEKYGLVREKDMIHYLLKYTYVDNWELELEEDYFSFDFDRLFKLGYIKYMRKYPLEYKRRSIWRDFRIWINCNTHVQLIMVLNKN